MIERVGGVVMSKGAEGVVLGVGGVGLLVETSAITLRDLPAVGEEVTLVTYLHVREEALQLFGFSTPEERELFRMFLGVSKIGPRLALAALSCRRAPELRKALAAGDVALLASVPGIGRKTAERIILELRERMGEVALAELGGTGDVAGKGNETVLLARSALVGLGYTVAEADRLLASLDHDQPVEELVRKALGSGQ